jgi:hypothetical protein
MRTSLRTCRAVAGGGLALLFAACAGHGPRIGAREGQAPQARLAEALDEAVAGRADWADLRIESECRSDEGFRSLALHGNGVGIWNQERQFGLTRDQVVDILRAFRRARFARLRETYGEGEEEEALIKVVCSVSLILGDVSKRVTQLELGPQSPELRRLAREVFAACRDAAAAGRTADSLSDGLTKVAAGALAPETLRVLFHRKPEAGAAPGSGGFLLRIDGPRATTQVYTPPEGYADPRVLELSPGEVADLARHLAESEPDGLPANLYADTYTDLTLRVLGRERSLQARRFAGLEPTTHGTRQQAFDRMVETLRALHLRVLAEGTPAPAAPESETP